jgi:hypothetical protein
MQLVSKTEKERRKKKKRSHSREDKLYACDKLTAWLFFCLRNLCAY